MFTYFWISYNMMILYFYLRYFHVSNSALFVGKMKTFWTLLIWDILSGWDICVTTYIPTQHYRLHILELFDIANQCRFVLIWYSSCDHQSANKPSGYSGIDRSHMDRHVQYATRINRGWHINIDNVLIKCIPLNIHTQVLFRSCNRIYIYVYNSCFSYFLGIGSIV